MLDKEREELESPDTWDYENAERRPPAKAARAVVSVAFSREEFDLVATSAEREGMKTSEFIREAALEKAGAHTEVTRLTWSGGTTGTFVLANPYAPHTLVSAKVSREERQEVTV
jgi:hypothetical protein